MLVLLVLISGCVSEGGNYDLSDQETVKMERLRAMLEGPDSGLPESITAVVRDIIDGDTIDVDTEAMNTETGEALRLEEYGSTGHARVRMVGINAPEKSPRGEILCSDVEVYEVNPEFADESRKSLLHLNDREVILHIDPSAPADHYGRILAVVEYGGEDICLLQLRDGMACGYYREPHPDVDEELYTAETLAARDMGIGMWGAPQGVKINIYSIPSNAKLFVDGVAVHHNTPSDEKELADVMNLLMPGIHVFSAARGEMYGEVAAEVLPGKNPDLVIILSAPEPGTSGDAADDQSPEQIPSPDCSAMLTEVMYDPLQNDNYNEWIEIFNPSAEPVDLSGLAICGKGVLPGYVAYPGGSLLKDEGMVLSGKSFAVITDGGSGTEAYENFDIDGHALMLHTDSSSICGGLSNSGRHVYIGCSEESDSMDYGEYAICDPGQSIQRNGTVWECGLPTPGY